MFTSNPGPSWQRPVVPIREENLSSAGLKISELAGQLKTAESHYTSDSDSDRQETAIPLVRALRNFAEGWGEFGKYQEQDKDRIKSYTKQKEILETALAINRKGADHEKIAKMLRKWGKSNYSLESFDKNNLDKEGVDPIEDAKTFHKLGNVHYSLEDYKEAEKCYKKALKINENTQLEIPKMLREFVNAHYSFNHPKAREYYEKIVNLNENMRLETAKMLHELIDANYDLKNPKEVKKCDEKVLDISKRISCIPEAEVVEMLNNLGSIYHALGDYQKAQETFEQVLPIFEKLNGSGSIKVGLVSRNIGRVYRNYEDPQKTEDLQKVKDTQKAEDLQKAEEFQKARDLQKIENLQKAKESFEKALPILKKLNGSEHIEVGITLNELGSVYYSLADLQKENEAKELYEKAKNLHQEALPIYEKFYGLNHVQVAKVLGNLDRDYYALNNLQEAQKSHEKELVIYHRDLAIKERHSPNSIEVAEALRNLGNTYYSLEEARKLYERELKILETRKKYYDSYTIETARDYCSHMLRTAGVHLDHNQIFQKHQKDKSLLESRIAKTLYNLGNTCLALGDHQKAKESFKEALAIEERHPDKFTDSNTLEKLKNATESFIKQLKETLTEKEENYPTGHFLIGQALRNLGDAYGELKDFQHQKECLEEALPILEKHLGDVNPTIQKVLEGLADAYNGLKNTKKAEQIYEEAAAVKSECQKIALAVKNRNKPNSTLDSTSAQAASHSQPFL